MRLPSEKETITFFESIGHRVEKRPGIDGGPDYWYFVEPHSPVGTKLDGLLQIWALWAPHAIHLINEDRKLRDFMSLYERGDHEVKAELQGAVADYWSVPSMPQRLSEHMNDRYPRSSDALPRDWKARVRKILAQPDGAQFFPARARRVLGLLDSTPL